MRPAVTRSAMFGRCGSTVSVQVRRRASWRIPCPRSFSGGGEPGDGERVQQERRADAAEQDERRTQADELPDAGPADPRVDPVVERREASLVQEVRAEEQRRGRGEDRAPDGRTGGRRDRHRVNFVSQSVSRSQPALAPRSSRPCRVPAILVSAECRRTPRPRRSGTKWTESGTKRRDFRTQPRQNLAQCTDSRSPTSRATPPSPCACSPGARPSRRSRC